MAAQAIARLSVCFLLLFTAMVAEAGPHKQKKVRCKDKINYPVCYKVQKLCPTTCPRTCVMNCQTCEPVCKHPPPPPPSPPPPPPKKRSPPPPPKKHSPPPPKKHSPPPPPPKASPSPPPSPASSTSPPPPLSVPPPPPASSSAPKTVKCTNKDFPRCYGMQLTCPSGCPDNCGVNCATCSPVCECNGAGAVCQDPRFVGGDGITFYFHGQKDHDFCLVSDSNVHINGHFIGKRSENMKRDFTWVQSLGILFGTHKIFIGARKTSIWDDSVDRLALGFDGEPIYLRDEESSRWQSMTSPSVTITRIRDANSVEIEVEGNFKIKATVVPISEKDSQIHNYGITQEDCFAHLDLSFKFYTLTGQVNGVLGQTYASNYVSRVKMGVLMPVLGGQKEFSSSSLFSTDCAVARFTGELTEENSMEFEEFGNLNCASGMDGRGVVCKR
ncbi:hypothetical protein I3760_14G104300 [Carya illinoinensis]|nr:hypothetical protein I3760_14G104300 [Carya illinoinensis]